MKKILILLVIQLLFPSLFSSCQIKNLREGEDNVAPVQTRIVSVSHVSDVSASDLRYFASTYGLADWKQNLQYDVSIDKLIYKTSYKGKTISASGLVYTPKAQGVPLAILSAHHGTTFKKSEAPSTSQGISEEEFAASLGFITLVPDYLGYGASAEIFHPYYDAQHSSAAVIDMIKASKEWLEKKDVALNSKLFLLGYSEGGYVTLATQKAIEADPSTGLELKGVAAGAGGYDLTQMLSTVTTSPTYTYPAYLAFVIQSFNVTYNWNKPLSYFFNNPYAERLSTALDGTQSGSQINSQLTTQTTSLLNPQFYQNLKNNTEVEFKNALIKNTLTNWKPKAPLRLYHGTADEIIPYKNSESVYNEFKQAGCAVELIPIQSGTHGSSLFPMIQSVYPWFVQLNN